MFLTPEVLNANESLPPGMESQLPDVFQYVSAPLPFQLRCAAIDGNAAAMQNATASVQQQVFALFIILFLSFAS
jgi:hypothetical protein